ncbi:hypothetical protein QFC22_006077 [Naganishia vaughanmartiniae]|uniref:Uncharacterized protein n=1 Tax=Naganishia vaughanmartiniae TaxID=1424756 RepID=A0ACC2WPA5_9TREE|nr:hypothetical protein QFC22_006077 [Naganishia vaughanmartiniae]
MDTSNYNTRFLADPRGSVYSTDVNDFYDGAAIPAPHRLTGNYSNSSPLATPNASHADLPRAYSIGSLSHLNSQSNNENGTTSRRQSGLGVYEGSSSYDNTPENEKPEFGAAAGTTAFPVNDEQEERGVFGDPQGRSAQRLAARRDREKGVVGAGYIPVSLTDVDVANTSNNNNNNTTAAASGGGALYSSPKPRTTHRRKWIIGAVLGLLLLLGLGVGLGVGLTVGRRRNTSSGNLAAGSGTDPSANSTDSSAVGTGTGMGNSTTTGGDASVFTKDARLHDSFYGFAYTPQAIKDTKVEMGIYVAVYVDADEKAYVDQVEAIKQALKVYGTENVLGGWGLDKVIPMGTSDAGSLMSVALASGIDYFHANVRGKMTDVYIMIHRTFDFFQEFDVDVADSVAQPPRCAIAETGWPTNSMTTTEGNNGVVGTQGDASIANLQIFLDTFVCQANANTTDYFFFEAFDEPWKAQYGGVEPYWGLFDSDRNLKSGLTIPDCSHH